MMHLELEHQHACVRLRERDFAHEVGRLVGGAQQRQQAADDQDRGGRKERRTGRQASA
jgi:hypothetical protein